MSDSKKNCHKSQKCITTVDFHSFFESDVIKFDPIWAKTANFDSRDH